MLLANFEDSPYKEEYENVNREQDKNQLDLRGLSPKRFPFDTGLDIDPQYYLIKESQI